MPGRVAETARPGKFGYPPGQFQLPAGVVSAAHLRLLLLLLPFVCLRLFLFLVIEIEDSTEANKYK